MIYHIFLLFCTITAQLSAGNLCSRKAPVAPLMTVPFVFQIEVREYDTQKYKNYIDQRMTRINQNLPDKQASLEMTYHFTELFIIPPYNFERSITYTNENTQLQPQEINFFEDCMQRYERPSKAILHEKTYPTPHRTRLLIVSTPAALNPTYFPAQNNQPS